MTSLHITMPDGSVWAVPASAIAHNYARHMANPGEYEAAYAGIMARPSGLIRWARNSMTWLDVHLVAKRIEEPCAPVDYARGWKDGAMEVVG